METITWIVLYLLLPMILGVLGNVLTPWVTSLFVKGSQSRREKRIITLLDEYRRIKRLKRDTSRLMILSLRSIATLIVELTLGLFGLGFVVLISFVRPSLVGIWFVGGMAILLAVATVNVYFFLSLMKTTNNVYKFDKFTVQTKIKLEKLGGDPADLDKEAPEQTQGG